jgi:hypothetical protein
MMAPDVDDVRAENSPALPQRCAILAHNALSDPAHSVYSEENKAVERYGGNHLGVAHEMGLAIPTT